MPLLIGGATTSRVHTAVKIAPHYEGPVVYVPDASRSVSVAQGLLSDQAATYIDELNADYAKPVSCTPTKANAHVAIGQSAWQQDANRLESVQSPTPKFIGRRVFKDFRPGLIGALHRLGPLLSDLAFGRSVPAILKDEVVGVEAPKGVQ
jgi:5-methyltetrahydrofolate--homocysteine methyltransferase